MSGAWGLGGGYTPGTLSPPLGSHLPLPSWSLCGLFSLERAQQRTDDSGRGLPHTLRCGATGRAGAWAWPGPSV